MGPAELQLGYWRGIIPPLGRVGVGASRCHNDPLYLSIAYLRATWPSEDRF